MRLSRAFLILGTLAMMTLPGWPPLGLAGPGERHSGTLITVIPGTGSVVLEEMVERGQGRQLRVRLSPQTQIVLSERLPAEQVTDLYHPFKDTEIAVSDLRVGDFVTVELTEAGDDALASSITVTWRHGSR